MRAPRGPTLLEISRKNRIPHASVWGGRAPRLDCRVRIDADANSLPAPSYPEAITLASIAAPRNVRLACQVRPSGALTATRLLRPATTGPKGADVEELDSAGVEKTMAVMFLDLRDFRQLSQSRLPYDVVFILNEFFAAASAAIHTHGGWIDKFLGDGLLAGFANATEWKPVAGRLCGPRAPSTLRSIASTPSSGSKSASRCAWASASTRGRCCLVASATARRSASLS